MKSILPDGFNSKNHHFYILESNNEVVGLAWVEIRLKNEFKSAWGYNIFIEPDFRRKGAGKFIFQSLSEQLLEMGIKEVSFHVYGNNSKAISLYEKFGFKTTSIVMKKDLSL